MKTKFYPKVGDKVYVRMFNKPDNKFYGEVMPAEIVDMDKSQEKPYKIKFADTSFSLWVLRKEIKGKAE